MAKATVRKIVKLASVAALVVAAASGQVGAQTTIKGKASTLDNVQVLANTVDKNQAWLDLIKRATPKSAADNKGKPGFGRSCSARSMRCINVLVFRNEEGKTVVLRETDNLGGQTLARHICVVNEFNDVRECVNFDSLARSVEVDEGQGWTLAAGSE